MINMRDYLKRVEQQQKLLEKYDKRIGPELQKFADDIADGIVDLSLKLKDVINELENVKMRPRYMIYSVFVLMERLSQLLQTQEFAGVVLEKLFKRMEVS